MQQAFKPHPGARSSTPLTSKCNQRVFKTSCLQSNIRAASNHHAGPSSIGDSSQKQPLAQPGTQTDAPLTPSRRQLLAGAAIALPGLYTVQAPPAQALGPSPDFTTTPSGLKVRRVHLGGSGGWVEVGVRGGLRWE